MKDLGKKTGEIKAALRLPLQRKMPTVQDFQMLAQESKRANRLVELPWHPEGRKDPVLITVKFEAAIGCNWLVYSGSAGDSSPVLWNAVDPEPQAVSDALRDWAAEARNREGWGKTEVYTPAPSAAPTTSTADLSFAGTAGKQDKPSEATPETMTAAGFPASLAPPPPPAPPPMLPQPQYQAPPAYGQPPYPPPGPAAPPPHWSAGYAAAPPPPQPWGLQDSASLHQPAQALALGDILVAAGIIPAPSLHAALTLQNAAGPSHMKSKLGEILVKSGALSPNIVQSALHLQKMARGGEILPNKVTDSLKEVHGSGKTVEEVLASRGLGYQAPASPDAWIASGPKTSMEAPPFVSGGYETIKPAHMRTSADERLEIEANVSDEERQKLRRVLDLVKDTSSLGIGSESEIKVLLALFKQAGMLTQSQIDGATTSGASSIDVVKALLVKEFIDPNTFEAGVALRKLMSKQTINSGQAIIALLYCQRSRVTVKEAVKELGWDISLDDL
jgi:hypothetical protein